MSVRVRSQKKSAEFFLRNKKPPALWPGVERASAPTARVVGMRQAPLALRPGALMMDYAGTFSGALVLRSHVTPNACSAALNAFDPSLRCMLSMAYSTSSGSACLETMP